MLDFFKYMDGDPDPNLDRDPDTIYFYNITMAIYRFLIDQDKPKKPGAIYRHSDQFRFLMDRIFVSRQIDAFEVDTNPYNDVVFNESNPLFNEYYEVLSSLQSANISLHYRSANIMTALFYFYQSLLDILGKSPTTPFTSLSSTEKNFIHLNMDRYYYYLCYSLFPFPAYISDGTINTNGDVCADTTTRITENSVPPGKSGELYPYVGRLLSYKLVKKTFTNPLIPQSSYAHRNCMTNAVGITILDSITNNKGTLLFLPRNVTKKIWVIERINISATVDTNLSVPISPARQANIPNNVYYGLSGLTIDGSIYTPFNPASQDGASQTDVESARNTINEFLKKYADNQELVTGELTLNPSFTSNPSFKARSLIDIEDDRRIDCTQNYNVKVEKIVEQKIEESQSYINTGDYSYIIDLIIIPTSGMFNASYVNSAIIECERLLDIVDHLEIDDPDWPLTRDDVLRYRQKYIYGPFVKKFYCVNATRETPIPIEIKYGATTGLIPLTEIREVDRYLECAVIFASKYFKNIKLAPRYVSQ